MQFASHVLNRSLPEAPWLDTALWRLPGTRPLDPALWLHVSDVFAEQMILRDRLMGEAVDRVYAVLPEAHHATVETLDLVLDALASDPRYDVLVDSVRRPDGIEVAIDRSEPLLTAGRLIQEDLCILQKDDVGEHRLTAAVLCFPASWTLSEKIGRSLSRLHTPIDVYDKALATRVERMFQNLRQGLILTRSNALIYSTPNLFLPRSEAEHDSDIDPNGRFLRSERQTLRRLPETNAILFTIHTFMVEMTDLTDPQIEEIGKVRNGIGGA